MSSCIIDVEGAITTSQSLLSSLAMDNIFYDEFHDGMNPEETSYDPSEIMETDDSSSISFSPWMSLQNENELTNFSSEDYRSDRGSTSDLSSSLVPTQENERLECEDAFLLEKALDEAVGDALSLCYPESNEQAHHRTIEDLEIGASIDELTDFTKSSFTAVVQSPPIAKAAPSHRITLRPQTTRVITNCACQNAGKVYTDLTTPRILPQVAYGNRKRRHSSLSAEQENDENSEFTMLVSETEWNHEGSNNTSVTFSSLHEECLSFGRGWNSIDQDDLTENPKGILWSEENQTSTSEPSHKSRPQDTHENAIHSSSYCDIQQEVQGVSQSPQDLNHELKNIKLELEEKVKQVTEWKNAAHAAFDAARKIRAQMELEKSRADKAESKVSQLSATTRRKRAKSRAKSFNFEEISSTKSSDVRDSKQPIRATEIAESSNKTEDANMADKSKSLLIETTDNQSSNRPNSSITVSKVIRSFKQSKAKNIKSPGINSCVRLALRAKVCSVSSSTLHTAKDVVTETETLLKDLPLASDSKTSDR